MSRTYRRAAPRNTGGAVRDEYKATMVNERSIRDGNSIRGCNGDDCDWCAENRLHSDAVRRDAARQRLIEEGF